MKNAVKKFNKKNTKYEIKKARIFLKEGINFKIYVLKPKELFYGRIVEINPDGSLQVTNQIVDYIYLTKNASNGITGFVGWVHRKEINYFRELAGFKLETFDNNWMFND